MVILVDLSVIFLASLSTVRFRHGSSANVMAFWQSFSVLFKDPMDLSLSCLSLTKHSNAIYNEYRMLRFFVRKLLFKFHQLLVWLGPYKTWTVDGGL